jgi:hypothetical protein
MGALLGLYWKVIGWGVLLLVAVAVWMGGVAGLVFASSRASGLSEQQIAATLQSPLVLIIMVLGYLAAAVVFGLVMRLYLARDVWERIASSTIVHNLSAAENVAARGEAAGALGEGLADGLDVGGF